MPYIKLNGGADITYYEAMHLKKFTSSIEMLEYVGLQVAEQDFCLWTKPLSTEDFVEPFCLQYDLKQPLDPAVHPTTGNWAHLLWSMLKVVPIPD